MTIYKNFKLLFLFSIILFSFQTAFGSIKLTDSAITVALKSKLLLEKDIPSTDIHITTKDGTVYLSGQVDTTLQSNRVIEIVFSISDVEAVDTSKFHVNYQPKSVLDDLITTAKVHGKIKSLAEKNDISNDYSIRVETFDHNVHLWGTVGNNCDIKVLHTFISRIPGVQKVHVKLEARK